MLGLLLSVVPCGVITLWASDGIHVFITGKLPGDTISFSESEAIGIVASVSFFTLIGGVCGALGTKKVARFAIRLITPPRRFSLRGLLLFMTGVAVLLSVTVVPIVRARNLYRGRKISGDWTRRS